MAVQSRPPRLFQDVGTTKKAITHLSVAQFGSADDLGSSGQRFKSSHSDHSERGAPKTPIRGDNNRKRSLPIRGAITVGSILTDMKWCVLTHNYLNGYDQLRWR